MPSTDKKFSRDGTLADQAVRQPYPRLDARARKVGAMGMLVALGLLLQIVEGSLPPVIPLPGAKLGLANLATLVALIYLGPAEAVGVNFLRCLLGGLLRGSFVGLLISISAGTAATLAMVALHYLPLFSLVGMSIAGAVVHNAVQLAVALWLVGFPGLRHYLPFLLLVALPTGTLIGWVALRVSHFIPAGAGVKGGAFG